MKKRNLILISSLLLLLGACSEVNGNEKLSDEYVEAAFDELNEKHHTKLPEDVVNGTVSEEIYKETSRFATDFQEFELNNEDFLNRLGSNMSLKEDDDFVKQFKEHLNSYDVFVKGFDLSPSTDADYEIERHLSDTLFYTSNIISALRQYISTGDKAYIATIQEDYDNRYTSYQALTNTIKKYKLDIEE